MGAAKFFWYVLFSFLTLIYFTYYGAHLLCALSLHYPCNFLQAWLVFDYCFQPCMPKGQEKDKRGDRPTASEGRLLVAPGMMAVAVSPSVQLAAVISSGFYSIWFLFSGFLIPRPRMPVWWRWYSYLDPGNAHHGFEGDGSCGMSRWYNPVTACYPRVAQTLLGYFWVVEWGIAYGTDKFVL